MTFFAFLAMICLNKICANDYLLFEPYIASNGWREADRGFTELYHRDSKKALREFEKSDSLGYPLGTYYLSYMLETYGDKEKSIEFLKKSAQRYCFLAKYTLGEKYRLGHSVAKDMDQAKLWLTKAMEDSQDDVDTRITHGHKEIQWDAYCCNALAKAKLGLCYIEEQRTTEGLEMCKTAYKQLKKAYESGVNADEERVSEPRISAFTKAAEALLTAYWAIGDRQSAYKLLEERVKLVHKNNYVYIKVVRDWRIKKEGFWRDNYREYGNLLDEIGKDKEISTAKAQYAVGKAIHNWNFQEGIHPWALAFLKSAAQNGNRDAQLLLGEYNDSKYLHHLTLDGDTTAFIVLISRCLDKKDTIAAKQWIGNSPLKLDSKVIEKEHQEDKRNFLIEQAANNGYMPAIRQMARKYSEAEDYKNAIYWLEKCDTLSIFDQQALSAYYYNIKDYEKAYPLLLQLDSQKNIHFKNTSVLLAEFYYEGYVDSPDYEKAMKYLIQSEKMNSDENTRVLYYLGMCYLKGNGVAKDEAKGFEYMKKAVKCNSIYIKAFWEISKCYRFGRGVKRDLKKAEEYEEKAAQYKNEDALWLREQQMQ